MRTRRNSLAIFVVLCTLASLLHFWNVRNLRVQKEVKSVLSHICDVAALTIGYNEESLAVFTIASVLPEIDRYAFVDTGSLDRTIPLLEHIFSNEIEIGKLRIFSKNIEDFDVSSARNEGLLWLKNQSCKKLLKIDADEVFYKVGAKLLVDTAKNLSETISEVEFCEYELYQNEVENNKDWMKSLYKDIVAERSKTIFYQFPHIPSKQRIFNHLENVFATGKWTDEAKGKAAENFHTKEGEVQRISDIINVHYGWARSLDYKRNKSIAWTGKPDAHPWVNSVNPNDPNSDLKPFRNHPEVIKDYIEKICTFLNFECDKI
ncbi:hypothetical protein GpartN1_g1769.t1 [Galdieria partita]|uniref:Uncharacterized protein n=1 Tax=Galdieria partita TaxID=83374 RepID=A0A9C7PSL2_9RHOD|nr:hypothetical protein GpartN1_g1769.t1 [Galdieria partita]